MLQILNTQPVEKQEEGTGETLDVFKIWLTLQGEGPFAGTPALFVRLAGCNLSSSCPRCDTDYTSHRERLTLKQILVDKIEELCKDRAIPRLIVLTGGEPFRQSIGQFANKAIGYGFKVQVETNGTLFQPNMPYMDWRFSIVCSPKSPKLNQQLVPFIRAYKYIIQAGQVDPLDGLPLTSMGNTSSIARPDDKVKEVFLQPLDEQDPEANKRNTQAAIDSCLRFGYRLSYQIHKLVGLE